MGNKPKTIMKTLVTQFVSLGILFFIVPMPALFSSGLDLNYLTNLLLIMNPAVVFGLNILYCMRSKFRFYVPLLGGGMFLPSVPIFYNTTALPYAIAYIVLAYIGAAVGISINKGNADTPAKM